LPNIKTKTKTLTAELLHKMDAYWRAANYLSVGQIYLYDNPLLKRPLALAGLLALAKEGRVRVPTTARNEEYLLNSMEWFLSSQHGLSHRSDILQHPVSSALA
jgi:hypothetical protein